MNVEEKVKVIREEIISEVEEEKEQELERVREKWEEEYSRFMERMETKREEILEKYRQKAASIREQIISNISLENKRKVRKKKQELLAKFMASLAEKLVAYREDEDYKIYLEKLITESIAQLESSELVLYFNEADRKIYLEELADRLESSFAGHELQLAEEPVEIEGGVIVESADQMEYIESTFWEQLQAIKPEVGLEMEQKLSS